MFIRKTSGSSWQYYKDEPGLDNKNSIMDFPANKNGSIFFKFKEKIIGKIRNDGTKMLK